jgi:hypothetical protein
MDRYKTQENTTESNIGFNTRGLCHQRGNHQMIEDEAVNEHSPVAASSRIAGRAQTSVKPSLFPPCFRDGLSVC